MKIGGMWRTLLAGLLALAAGAARAEPSVGDWALCRGPAPAVTDCRPVSELAVDPQGRELFLRGAVRTPRSDPAQLRLHLAGAMATEAWFNGVKLGANGRPAANAADEQPGLYQTDLPIDPRLWRASGNVLVLRMSSHHTGLRFAHPVAGVWIGPDLAPQLGVLLAITFAAAGALTAAAFGFGAVYAIRRTGSSLTLAALSGVAATQALVENLRNLVAYRYPFHAWRVSAIWALSAGFALLLVAYAAGRFAPRRRGVLLGVTVALVAASLLQPGFDDKTGTALLVGVVLAGVAAALGVWARRPGARPVLAYLAAFVGVALALPRWLLDVSFFLLAASLVLPLLVADVVRLSRDSRDRESALSRAASRPDRLTVASAKGVELTPLKDIVAVLGADDYVELRLAGGRSLLHDERLERLADSLPSGFLRVHRSAIANLAHVERLERDGARWRLHMADEVVLPVSRSRLSAVRDALDPPAVAARASA